MNVLILGGTRFVGRHLAEAALARGHEVTLFNRGQTGGDLFPKGEFPKVERLRGDRGGDLSALRGRSWDAVVDTCGYVPRLVRASAESLKDAVGRYVFISSISVYADLGKRGLSEDDAVGRLEDEGVEEVSGETYGPLKALCEQAAEASLPGRVLNVRPGLVVGPHDPTDRFTYWPWRLSLGGEVLGGEVLGGEVLAPGDGESEVQFIDARDLADWTLKMLEAEATGTYNAVGPNRALTMREFLEVCREVAGREVLGSGARLTWVDEAFLRAEGVEPWSDLPLWLPQEAAGLSAVDSSRAQAKGLCFRPLEATVADILRWAKSLPEDAEKRAGLSLERERELLRRYHAREQARL